MADVQMNICTDGKGSTVDSLVKRTMDTKGKRSQATTPQYIQQRKDIEIDQYIFELITQGLVDQKWKRYHCDCIYKIGIERYNSVVLDVREAVLCGKEGRGKLINSPAALLSYKLKGTMQLHYKQQFMREA